MVSKERSKDESDELMLLLDRMIVDITEPMEEELSYPLPVVHPLVMIQMVFDSGKVSIPCTDEDIRKAVVGLAVDRAIDVGLYERLPSTAWDRRDIQLLKNRDKLLMLLLEGEISGAAIRDVMFDGWDLLDQSKRKVDAIQAARASSEEEVKA